MEPNYKIYLGVCTQNNDPEMRGRIKIFIPQMAPTIKNLNENVDKFYNFIGKETNSQISQIIDDLNNVLPWAEYAGPICGGNASGRYNAQTETGTTSDSNAWLGDNMIEGFRPVQHYIAENTHPDAFTETGLHKNKFVNQYAYQYTPTNYSGLARGIFSIPNVGAHVYVFFSNGDRNFPTYFASAYSQEDVKRIFTLSQDVNDNSHVDYPSSYENIKKDKADHDTKTFRAKTVINSNKHTIELIDTDLREIMKFTHYSGSFKEFNNYSTIELATGNDQKLILQDQFLTTKKNKSEYVGLHKELIVGGDNYINIGETDQTIVQEILSIHKQFHEYKLLFDVQRALYGEHGLYGNPNDLSIYQKRKGINEVNGIDNIILYNNDASRVRIPAVPQQTYKDGYTACPICKGKRYNPYDTEYGKNPLDLWKEASQFIALLCQSISTADVAEESGASTGTESGTQSLIFSPECHKYYLPVVSEAEEVLRCVSIIHPFLGQIGYYAGMPCACCGGTGFSPSTEAGEFELEPAKQSNGTLDKLILSKSPELFKLEKQLGAGGDEIKTISMNKIETIGLAMNNMKSFRVDPMGKLKIDGCWVAPQKTYDNFKPSPHVEYVDVADIPGGDYVLTCMNKYKLLVGARGINIETYGPIDIYGTIVNFAAEQMNISSKNEIVIDGGERLSLRARKISLLPVEHNAVVVDGQLHVTRNTVIEGGIMLEGEVGLLHITAPLEWQTTEIGLYDGPSCFIKASFNAVPGVLEFPSHTHYFKNIPFTPLPNRESVRETMIQKGINSRINIAAATIASNPANCSPQLWNRVSKYYQPIAWIECKKQATAQGVNVDKNWAQWDATALAGKPLYNAPMTNDIANGRICQSEELPDGSIITTITAIYKWEDWEKERSNNWWSIIVGNETRNVLKEGFAKVTGKIDNKGNMVEGPTLI